MIALVNRRLYNWFGFVLFFYNSLAGVFRAVIRIAINVVFGILLIFRLDIQILTSHLWWWDFGKCLNFFARASVVRCLTVVLYGKEFS